MSHSEPTTETRPVDDCTMTAGEASDPLVVLLHGAGASAEVWEEHLSLLADEYRVVAVDLPGHRDHPEGAFAYDEAVATVRAVIADEGQPAILVGHSVGGYVASKFVERYPDRVDAVLTSGSYLDWRRGRGLLLSGLYAYVMAPLMKLGKYSEFWKNTVVDRISHEEYASETASGDAIYGATTAMQETAFTDVWAGIERFDGPALVGAGSDEPFVEDYGPELAERAGATFEYMPFEGHNGPVTRPEAFVSVLDRFVRDNGVVG